MAQIFEYAVILDEVTDRDGKVTQKAELVVPVTPTLAKDAKQAELLASRAIPQEFTEDPDKFDRLTVVVRDF